MQRSRAAGSGVLAWVRQNQMARSVKSFSELQRQLIGAELGRREAASRKVAVDTWQLAFDDTATAPPVVKVVETNP